MNKQNKFLLFSTAIILLLVGVIFFHFINQEYSYPSEENGFRTWFWEKRGLDIMVQILLVFAGALGIAAILPIEDEDD